MEFVASFHIYNEENYVVFLILQVDYWKSLIDFKLKIILILSYTFCSSKRVTIIMCIGQGF